MATSTLSTPLIVSRIAASLLGSWLFVWGLSSLSIAGLAALGVDYHEAQTFVMLLAFLVLLVAFCWAIAAVSLARVWGVLAGGGVTMSVAAWVLARALT